MGRTAIIPNIRMVFHNTQGKSNISLQQTDRRGRKILAVKVISEWIPSSTPFLWKASLQISGLSQRKPETASALFLSRGSYVCLQHRPFQSSSRKENIRPERKVVMNVQAKVFQRGLEVLGVPVLEHYVKCLRESSNKLQAPTLQIKSILKMSHLQLPKIIGHLYAYICIHTWLHVCSHAGSRTTF